MADAASFSYADASIGTDTLCFSIVYYQHTVLCKSVEWLLKEILAENLAHLNLISQYILKEYEETNKCRTKALKAFSKMKSIWKLHP